jgi:hypothetical protein
LSLFTGIIFLNMSFFLVEISALKTESNRRLLENISKLVAGSSAEEEQDAFGGYADEDTSANEVDLFLMHIKHPAASCMLISKCNISTANAGNPLFGNYEIYSPPPEV